METINQMSRLACNDFVERRLCQFVRLSKVFRVAGSAHPAKRTEAQRKNIPADRVSYKTSVWRRLAFLLNFYRPHNVLDVGRVSEVEVGRSRFGGDVGSGASGLQQEGVSVIPEKEPYICRFNSTCNESLIRSVIKAAQRKFLFFSECFFGRPRKKDFFSTARFGWQERPNILLGRPT